MEENDKYKHIVQYQTELIVCWLPGGVRTFVNESYCQLSGQPREALIGTSFYNLVSPNDLPGVLDKIEGLTPEHPIATDIREVLLTDGSTGWQEWTDQAFFDDEGKVREYQSVGRDITHRIRVENALKESEEKWQAFSANFPDLISVFDASMNYVSLNRPPDLMQANGIKAKEMIGRSLYDYLPENQRVKIKKILEKIKKTRKAVSFELTGRSSAVYENTYIPIIKQDKITGIIAVSKDITEKKQAEEKLQESEKHLSLIYNHTRELMLLLEVRKNKLIHISMNDKCHDMAMAKKAFKEKGEAIGMSLMDFFTKVLGLSLLEANNRAAKYWDIIQSKKSKVFEQTTPMPDGTDLHHETTITPILDTHNKVTHLLVVIADITDKKIAEMGLVESGERYRTLVEHAPEAIVVLDIDTGKFIDFNQNAVKLFKTDREALYQVGPAEVSPKYQPGGERSKLMAAKLIGQALEGDTPVFEWTHMDSEGQQIPCEISLVRIPSFDRKLIRGSITDITERKKAEKALKSSEAAMRLLKEAITAAGNALNADEATEIALHAVSEFTGWPVGHAILLADNREPRDIWCLSNEKKFSRIIKKINSAAFQPGRGISGLTFERQEAIWSDNILTDKRLSDLKLPGNIGVRAGCGFPVNVNGKVQAVLEFYHEEALVPESALIDLIKEIAVQLGRVIERKIAIEALKESELKWLSLVENSTNRITIFDAHDNLVFVNHLRDGDKQQGLKEMVGKNLLDLLPDDQTGKVKQALEEVRTHRKSVTCEIKEKKGVHLENIYIPILKEGDYSGLIVVSKDITERKETEKRIKENEQRLDLAIKSAALGTYDWHMPSKTIYWNKRMYEIFGVDESDPRNQVELFEDLLHPDDRDRASTKGNASVKDLGFHEDEYRIITPDNNVKYIISKYIILGNEEGEAERVIGTCQDVTLQKVAENALIDSEKRLSLVYNNTNDIMVLLSVGPDNELTHISVNDRYMQMVRNQGVFQHASEVLGLNFRELLEKKLKLPPELVKERIDRHLQPCRSKQPATFDLATPAPNGTIMYHETSLTPILNEKGECTNLLVVIRDISDRKKAELALQEAFEEVNRLKRKLEQENIYLREEINLAHNFEDIIFASEAFREVLNRVEQVAMTDATVLIQGETGTGKELIARAIHNISDRKDRPLVKVNCSALPKELIESELFGHEKGAFTGASQRKIGRFELADGGSIFLDEIGELPVDLQVKLLRVLQEGEFERLGSSTTLKVDVRIISATNRDLEKEVNTNNFRQDLYYRLNVFPVKVPPLRDRVEDIQALLQHFVAKFSAKFKKHVALIPESVLMQMQSYHWPGNVRELENLVERAIIVAKNETLHFEEFSSQETGSGTLPIEQSAASSLRDIEKQHIMKILRSCGWVITGPYGAAKQLGLPPSTLRDKMKKLGIARPAKPVL